MSIGSILAVALSAAAPASDAAPTPVAAQPIPPASSASSPPPDAGLTRYQPSFFAGVQPNTALDMVNNLPGFSLDTGDSVRGFGGSAGNVLIDGERPATKNDSLDEILKRIPARSVARIDVIRGSAPGIDMQGKTMIANVIRVRDDGLKLTTAVQGTVLWDGRFDYGLRIEGSKRSGETSYEGSLLIGTGADDGTGNGPRTIRNAAGVVTQTAYEKYFGDGGVDKATASMATPVLGGKFSVEGSFIRNPYYSDNNDTLIDPPGSEFEHYTSRQDTGEIGAHYERGTGPRSSVEFYALQQLGLYASNDTYILNGDDELFTLDKRTGESILRGIWKYNPFKTLSLESGLEGDFNWLTSHTLETDDGAPIDVPAANVHVTELRGEAFTDATWRALPTLTFEAGIRVEASAIASTGDVVSSEKLVYPKPRGVVTWSPGPNDQVRLRLEREVSQLDFGNFTASGTLSSGEHAGNPTLIPQQDWVIEAAYDRKFWTSGDVGLTLRRYWYTDVIDLAPTCAPQDLLPGNPPVCNPDDEFAAPANIGSGSREEIAANLTLPTDKIGLKNGLLTMRSTWRFSGVTDPSTHETRGISGLHPLDAEAHFTQGLTQLKSTWGFDWFSSWRQTEYLFNEVDVQRLGLWFDVYFEYKPRPDFAVKFEADNLTSHGLEQVREFYEPFRDVNGGALSSIDDRDPHFGPEFSIRLRKTFG